MISRTVKDMEKDKFIDGGTREPKVRVKVDKGFEDDSIRLMLSYQSRILSELEKLNKYMELITEEEL